MDIISALPYASTGMIDALRGAADIIEQVSETLFYFGFCKPGTTGTDQDTWSIMRITVHGEDPNVTTTFTWAKGMCCYNMRWDDRAEYEYLFKNF